MVPKAGDGVDSDEEGFRFLFARQLADAFHVMPLTPVEGLGRSLHEDHARLKLQRGLHLVEARKVLPWGAETTSTSQLKALAMPVQRSLNLRP